MASQHVIAQHTSGSTPHLDGYLKGIRDEFDHLIHELDETRKQRDEYITKYRSQVEELRQLRQTISSRENTRVTDDSTSPPVSSSNYYSPFDDDATSDQLHSRENAQEIGHLEEERNLEGGNVGDGSYLNKINVAPILTGTASLSLHASASPANEPGYSAWDIGFNTKTTARLNLNLVRTLTSGEGRKSVTYSTDGKYLATASSSGIVSIFDSKTGERIMHSVTKDSYHVGKPLPSYECLEFSPDNKYLATGESNGNVQIWSVSQKTVRKTFRHRFAVDSLNFSPNGRSIVTCLIDTIIIWRLRDGSSRVLTASDFYPWSVRFSLDGRYIASGGSVGKIRIWNVRTGKPVARWQGHSSVVRSLVFTPDGSGLLSGSSDKQVIQWDVSSLSSLGMTNPPIYGMTKISSLIGHTDRIRTVSISPDGKWIASGSFDCTVRIWNAHDATLHCTLECPGSVFSVDFSPVGNCLAIGGDFEGVTIWNYVNS